MDIPVNAVTMVMALFPIVLTMMLKFIFKWRPAESVSLPLFISAVTGVAYFESPSVVMALECAKAIWASLILVVIVWSVIFMYEFMAETGAVSVIKGRTVREPAPDGMGKAEALMPLLIFIIAYAVIIFLQPVRNALDGLVITQSYPETQTALGYVNEAVESFMPFYPFTYSGTWLLIGVLAAYLYFRMRGWTKPGCVGRAALKASDVSIEYILAFMGFLMMLMILHGSGAFYVFTALK